MTSPETPTAVSTPLAIVAGALCEVGVAGTTGELLTEASHALSALRRAGWRIVRTDHQNRITADWQGATVGPAPDRRRATNQETVQETSR